MESELPFIQGTLVNMAIERLPSNRDPKPLWLGAQRPDATVGTTSTDCGGSPSGDSIEHRFRFSKQTLGLTERRLLPEQADG